MTSLYVGGRAAELRRYSREAAPWPVILETSDGWWRLSLIDLSPRGAKVRFTEPLKEGTKGRVHFLPPHWRPRAVEAIVGRIDLDGVVLLFTGSSIAPPAAARDVLPPGAWFWTWKACAPSPCGDRQKTHVMAIEPGPGAPRR